MCVLLRVFIYMYYFYYGIWINEKEICVYRINNVWYVKFESLLKSIKVKKNSVEKFWC